MAFFPRALSLSRTISRTGTLTLLCLAPTSLNCVFYRENNLAVAVHGNRLPTRRANAKVERVVPWRAVALAEAAQRVDEVIALCCRISAPPANNMASSSEKPIHLMSKL